MPMLLKTLDFKTFEGSNKGPFDFLTAYVGVGYSGEKVKIIKKSYTVEDDAFIQEKFREKAKSSTRAASFGFYGGEKFLVVDTRVVYYRGEIRESKLLNDSEKFSRWVVLLGIGIGF